MRFDAASLAEGVTRQLVVLMRAELLDGDGDGDAGRARRGDESWVRDVVRPFQDRLQEVLRRWDGTLQSETAAEFEMNFATADAAVNAALALHQGLYEAGRQGPAPGLRVGIHVGQIVRFGGTDESREIQVGRAMDVCRRLTGMAAAGQTLLTRGAFDVAREYVRQAPAADGDAGAALSWNSYGRYLLTGLEESQEICEVGVSGRAPLTAPPDSAGAQSADSLEEARMQGWRPAPGQEVPHQPGWIIERKLGEGGFGEVWLANQRRNPDQLVFKFCFDSDRLTSFKREQTLFRLLDDALGNRPDIARLRQCNLEKAPYFLESEYIKGGNLRDWCEADGHLASLPLEERLRLVAEIAAAVAAAHSVGIIHKDLKPSNIFMRQAADGRWHPMLADFGIGAVADRSQLERRGITVAGFTQSLLEPGSSRTGTRMYQPPEANVARTATVQGDVYALGVLLYQMVVGDFDQPLGHGWERRLKALEGAGGEVGASEVQVRLSLLREDIGQCVDGDPAARLASAAQLVERLQGLDARIADALALRRAERARLRMRRLRAALVMSVTALVVVGGLGGFAVLEWRRAEALKKVSDQNEQRALAGEEAANKSAELASRNEQLAEARAKEARANAEAARQQSQLALDTLRAMIFDIQRSVENLPGTSPIRRRLLGTALQRLEQLSGEFVQRANADRHTAAALQGLGDLVLQFGEAPRTGESGGKGAASPDSRSAAESARRFHDRAMKILEALANADPKDAQARRDLFVSYSRLGDVYLRLGDTDKALQHYRKGLELREALNRADPNDAQARRDVFVSYNNLGHVYLRLDDADKALQHYRKGLELCEALNTADPNDAEARRDLSVSYNNLGDVYLRLGATDKALLHYRKGLELCEALAKADPNDAQAASDLSFSYSRMAKAHEKAGDLARARDWDEKMLAVDRRLSERMPGDVRARREVAGDCQTLSHLCARARDWPAAVSYARQAIEHAQAARKIAGATQPFEWNFAITWQMLVEAQIGAGQMADARRSIAEAKASPRSAAGANSLAWLLATHWADPIRDGKAAIELATRACEMTQWKDPLYMDTLAAAYAEAGRFDDAVKWQKKALDLADKLSKPQLDELKGRLKLYEARKPYHVPRPEPATAAPHDRPSPR